MSKWEEKRGKNGQRVFERTVSRWEDRSWDKDNEFGVPASKAQAREEADHYHEAVIEKLCMEFEELNILADTIKESVREMELNPYTLNLLKLVVKAIEKYDNVLDNVAAA